MSSKVEELAASLTAQLAKKELPPARTLTLKLKTSDFKIHSRQTTEGGPFQDYTSVVTAAQALLAAEIKAHGASRSALPTSGSPLNAKADSRYPMRLSDAHTPSSKTMKSAS